MTLCVTAGKRHTCTLAVNRYASYITAMAVEGFHQLSIATVPQFPIGVTENNHDDRDDDGIVADE